MIPQHRHVPERAFVARHGQTVDSGTGRLSGRGDAPLTAEGLRQARSMALRLVDRGVTTVCTSPLGRAVATALVIAETIGADIREVDDLTEIHHGDLTGLTWDEAESEWPGIRADRAENRYGWAFPGGESYAQARLRARRALAQCGWESSGPPLLVTHEMMSRMVRAELGGLDPAGALGLRHPYGVVFDVAGRTEHVI